MKFIAVLRFVLLQFLMDLTGRVNTMVVTRADCRSRRNIDYTCPENYQKTDKNNYPTCSRFFSEPKTAMEAVEQCEKLNVNLIDLISPDGLDDPSGLIFNYSNREPYWVMPVKEGKRYDITADTLCPAMTKNNIIEKPCGDKARVVCEREAIEVDKAKQKPVVTVNGRGNFSELHLFLYEGTRVTLGCSVIRVRRAQLELYVKDTRDRIWIFNSNNLTFSVEKASCGVITTAYTRQALGLTVRNVKCLADGISEKDCYINEISCTIAGPYFYVPGNVGLQLFVQFHGRTNIVLNEKELLAFCFSHNYDYKHFRFAIHVDKKMEVIDSNIELRPEGHARYTYGSPAAVLKLNMSEQCLGGKQFDLLCYDQERIFGPISECARDSLFCSTIRVIVDYKPLLEVKGKEFRQDTHLYEKSNVIITCSYIRPSEVKPTIHLSDSPAYSRGFTGKDLNVEMEKGKCGVRTSATLELFLNTSMDLMKKFVTCSIGSADFTPCADNNIGCVQRGPLDYLSAPKKVELKVNNVSVSPNIIANCTSFGFKTVWALTDLSNNRTLNVLTKHDRGVKIEEMEVPEEKAWISHLTVQTKVKGLAGETLTLGCYTEKIYADQPECLEFYFWCDTIVLKIDPEDEDGITFMKIGLIVLASLLPLVLISVCCMMFNLCPCPKKPQPVPVPGVPSPI